MDDKLSQMSEIYIIARPSAPVRCDRCWFCCCNSMHCCVTRHWRAALLCFTVQNMMLKHYRNISLAVGCLGNACHVEKNRLPSQDTAGGAYS